MTILEDLSGEYANWGWRGIPQSISKYYHRRRPFAKPTTSIWDQEWDMLIVLDSCRPEWVRQVVSEYDFLESVDTIYSVGSHSIEWIDKTFRFANPDVLTETVYITGNHYAHRIKNADFSIFENLNGYSGEFPAPPAHIITDRTVDICRENDWERCIVHYMQPHKPFLRRSGKDRREVKIANEWSKGHQLYHHYFNGSISKEELINGFINNLRYVLDEVSILLDNVEAPKTIITSDHGQALGERFIWDHHPGVKIDSLKEVPWIECAAKDKQQLEPMGFDEVEKSNNSAEKRLKHLGYT